MPGVQGEGDRMGWISPCGGRESKDDLTQPCTKEEVEIKGTLQGKQMTRCSPKKGSRRNSKKKQKRKGNHGFSKKNQQDGDKGRKPCLFKKKTPTAPTAHRGTASGGIKKRPPNRGQELQRGRKEWGSRGKNAANQDISASEATCRKGGIGI